MHKSKLILLYCLSGLLFLGCFRFGLLLAEHKPLWNDEVYSQVANISLQTHADFFLGRVDEGNNFPLFYSLQKVICDLVQYQTLDLWHDQNIFDFLLLRLSPVFFTSLTIACIFFYFARFHSFFTGVYSLFLTFSSLVIWKYWAEARPYALWMFLTTIQALYFLYLCRQEKMDRKAWTILAVIHFLLSLTVVFGLAQIAIVSGLLWIFKKERNWKNYIFTALIPISIALFYYVQAPRYQFFFNLTPEQLIRECFSRDRFYILFIFIFFLGSYYLGKKTGFPKSFPNKILLEGIMCFSITVLMLSASFCVLAIFKMQVDPHAQSGFPVSSRYFVYLTPIGIISTTVLSMTVFRSLSGNRWIQILVLGGMGYLVIYRFLRILPHIKNICAPALS